ncbi:PAS domain-containing protein [Phyllobacterium leguminum]|uniref:PAS domain-containing protein n=1 Tax=Phyllobacterium leguminum TaxID=314237 RepID=A0A318SWJ5_9HYPH|nr:PAS domain-containing protein [Phyllobacterium leguminum]PYE86331.1 hypothetical protein C7477_12833 [Phyllobacterium leguminum]
MKHDGTAALLAYWNRIRGKRPAPERSEIEPGAIARQLPDIFILEQPETEPARFRLAGTRLCANHGGELKNSSFLSLWAEEDRDGVEHILQMVAGSKRAAVIDIEAKSLSGRSASFEMLLLPLANGKLIGSMIALEHAYWLGADRIIENSVRAIRMIDPRRAELQVTLKAAACAGASAYFPAPPRFASPAPSRQIRHLTVLKGGKG